MSLSWPSAALGEVCDVQIGKTPARSESAFWGGDHVWLSIADMNQGRALATSAEGVTDKAVRDLKLRSVDPGTVLLSFKLSIGKVGIAQCPMFTNEAIAHLPITDPRLDRDYLYWTLKTIPSTGGADRAAMGATLNKSKLKQIEVPLPPLEEQKRIAAILDAADNLRTKRRQAPHQTRHPHPSHLSRHVRQPAHQQERIPGRAAFRVGQCPYREDSAGDFARDVRARSALLHSRRP